MTPAELAKGCHGKAFPGGYVLLDLTRPTPPTGEKVRLTPRSGPFGEIYNVRQEDGGFRILGRFNAKSVLRWMARNDLT